MSGMGAIAVIWFIVTAMFATKSVVDHPSFYSIGTIVFLFLFVSWLIAEVSEE